MASLPEIVQYADDFLHIRGIEEYPNALNGLQIENSGEVTRIAAAVDASTQTLRKAAQQRANLLIVHHGLFWAGLKPVTGTLRGQIKLAFEQDVALYSAHLPLDYHPEIGNNALLARALGIESFEPFLEMKGRAIGVKAPLKRDREQLLTDLEAAVGGPVHCTRAGPAETRLVGIVTGSAGGEVYAAAADGVDTYITGEAPHWAAVAAEELGINLILGGHYATETFGVKALAAHLAERFKVPWFFVDHPTGL